MEQVTENVHDDVTFMAFDFLSVIDASLLTGILGFHALCVDYSVTSTQSTLICRVKIV